MGVFKRLFKRKKMILQIWKKKSAPMFIKDAEKGNLLTKN